MISGHRGLPSAKLFTDIDRLVDGDTFMIHVLDEALTYEVDQILTVLLDDVSALAIDPNQDYVTLVTCTLYSVNSHRLLVIPNKIKNARVISEASRVEPSLVAPILAIFIFILLLLAIAVYRKLRY